MRMDFALEWIIQTPVFGQLRDMSGHQFHASELEMHEQADILKANVNVLQITYYRRENGIMLAIGDWSREEVIL